MKRLTVLLLPVALFAAQGRYARLGDFQGKVEVQLQAADPWKPAERNLPLAESAWLRTGPDSRVEIELDEGSVWRTGPDSQFEISDYSRLSSRQRITTLSLDHGIAYFTGQAEGKDAMLLVVPGAQVAFTRGAKVRLEVEDTWSQISVLEGTVRFSSPAAEMDLHEGQYTRVEPANPSRFFLDRHIPPHELDRWSAGRDKALAGSTSAAHVMERSGLQDLDAAGVWVDTADLGMVWKPKDQADWMPFQNGRWRWYDALGYTWVSDDSWGWLPYHYGRWSHRENLGWVWAPAGNTIFKPGDVYWLQGPKLAGWGPLAPGELWNPSDPDIGTPQQYLNAYTTYAALSSDAVVIDPAGFTGRPKEPLKVAAFRLALPSPAFLATRLEATRPPLMAGSTRIVPILDGVTHQNTRTAPIVVIAPTPPPPVVIVSEPQAPPPPPETIEVPVPYPVAVYTGIAGTNPPGRNDRPRSKPQVSAASKPAPPATGTSGTRSHVTPPPREKKFRKPAEQEVATEAIRDVTANRFAKALPELDSWSQKYEESEYKADRLYYYILAYNGLQQPAKVVDTTARLLSGGLENTLEDPRQMILALYLASLSIQKIPYPSHDQFSIGQVAARNLLEFVPTYFTEANRPAGTTAADWSKAQSDLETTAKTTLASLSKRRSSTHQ